VVEIRVLVTGATGFIGSYLCRLLVEEGFDVYGTFFNQGEVDGLGEVKSSMKLLKCDVSDRRMVDDVVRQSEPEVVYHLAAQSYPTVSWKKPVETFRVNVEGTVNLFESIMSADLDSSVVVACSSAEYGLVRQDEVPVKEDHALLPLHPYGVSKVAQDLLAYQYFRNHGVKTVRLRFFNTTGPGKLNDVCGDYTRMAVECERKGGGRILVGNTKPRRDITDVRDTVKAVYLSSKLADSGDVFNVCSMHAVQVKEILDVVLSMTKVDVEVGVDEKKLRPSDEPIIMGDNTRFVEATGWRPAIPLEETLSDMLEYWRNL
jgi:GDP-4-dehydro-6-deoxy-D-mannose reductase